MFFPKKQYKNNINTMTGNDDVAPKDELPSSCKLILQHVEAGKKYFENFTSV